MPNVTKMGLGDNIAAGGLEESLIEVNLQIRIVVQQIISVIQTKWLCSRRLHLPIPGLPCFPEIRSIRYYGK
jgi:hypothetical protein